MSAEYNKQIRDLERDLADKVVDPAIADFYELIDKYYNTPTNKDSYDPNRRALALNELRHFTERYNLTGEQAIVSGVVRPDMSARFCDDESNIWVDFCEDYNITISEDDVSEYIELHDVQVTLFDVRDDFMTGDSGVVGVALHVNPGYDYLCSRGYDYGAMSKSLFKERAKQIVAEGYSSDGAIMLDEIYEINLLKQSEAAIHNEIEESESIIFGDTLRQVARLDNLTDKLAVLAKADFKHTAIIRHADDAASTLSMLGEYFKTNCDILPTNCKTKLVDHDDEFVAKIKCAELIYDQDNEQLLPYIRLEVDSYQDDDGQYEFIVDPGDIEVVEVLRPKQETIENLASRALFAMQYVYGYEDKDENADRKVIASQVRDEIDSSYEQRERVLAYSQAREIYKSLAKSYEFIAEEGELSEKVHNLQDEIIGLSQELSAIANTHPEVLWIQMDGVAAFKLSGAPGGSTASMEKKATEYDYDLRQTSSFKEHVYARVRGEFSPRQQPVLTRLEDDRYKMHLVSYVYDPSDTHMTESPMADSVVNYKTCITQLENAEIKFMHEVDEERYSEVALALEDVPSSSVAPLAYLVQQVREEEALTPGDRTRLLDLNRGELIYDVSKLDHKPKVAAVLDLLLKDRHMYIDVGYNNSEALKIYGVDVDQNEMHIRAIDTSTDELVTVPLLYLVGSKITKIS